MYHYLEKKKKSSKKYFEKKSYKPIRNPENLQMRRKFSEC